MHWILTADGVHAALAGAGGWIAALARAAAPVAVEALWQGAAIALVLGLCFRLMPRIHVRVGAAQRFVVWAAAFAAVAGLPLLPSLARSAAKGIAANTPIGASTPGAWFEFDERWALAIATLWLAASLMRAVGLGLHALRLRRIWKAATPVAADAKIRELLAEVSTARRSSLRSAVELCTTRELDRPSVIGFLAPRILIPDWLFARLTPASSNRWFCMRPSTCAAATIWTNLLAEAGAGSVSVEPCAALD